MQNLELLLLVVSCFCLILNYIKNTVLYKYYIIGLVFIVLIAHLIFDGFRWQMIPTYIIWFITVISLYKKPKQGSSNLSKIVRIIGLVFLISFAAFLPSALPVFQLPKTTGPFIVGTKDLVLKLNRDEVITANKTDTRTLMIKVWYPSHYLGKVEDPYADIAGRNGFAQKYGLPTSMLNYLDKVETNVYRDIKIAEKSFPVLIFSHGYNSKANGYYALLSEIVSQGYIVFAINHTYESTGATFPDGTLKYFNYDYASEIQSGTWETMEPVVGAFKSELSFEKRHPLVQKGLTTYFVRDMVERWAEDIVDVVNELQEWNNKGFFERKLDLSNVGVFGHSRGGGAAGESLLIDSRIKAGVNIDGVQWGRLVDNVFQKPFLYLSSDWPEAHENLNQHAYINKSTSVFYEGVILKSGHSNFMDIPFMIPMNAVSQAGDVDPNEAIKITAELIVSFFDKHLKNQEVDFDALSSTYEMLNINIHKGDSIRSNINKFEK